MNSSDPPSETPGSTELPKKRGAPPDKTKEQKPKWSLNEAALAALLNRFSSERDKAGEEYVLARRKVVRYFEYRKVVQAEDCADETFDRVARRIQEGQQIENLMAYIFGVARMIYQEWLKTQPIIDGNEVEPPPVPPPRPEPDPDVRLICFDRCIEEIGVENRDLILGYYEGEGREKIDNRLALAKKLGIPLNALRIRVHRIKRMLEECIANCLQNEAGAKQLAP